ncbi:MAG: efflux RND transporter periplasmic adaptor subunit [Candidatus Tectimicrobiota bacterium]
MLAQGWTQRRASGIMLGVCLWLLGDVVMCLAQPAMPAATVLVKPVLQQQTATELEVVGTVEPYLTTTLSAEISGLTSRFEVREGDAVQQGKTLIAQLKATELELLHAEAEADLTRAREALKKLKVGLRKEEIDEKRAEVVERKTWMEKNAKDLERMQAMQKRDIASMSQFDLAESTYLASKAQYERAQQTLRVAELGSRQEDIAGAEAEVQRLQARVQRLRDDVQKTSLRSPVSGVVTQRYAEVGQWLERGAKVADVIVLHPVLVRVPVHEKDIVRLRLGDEATVVLDALPERPFSGRVKHIVPQADLASRTFPVKIEVANTPDTILKAGMFARVTLRSSTLQPTLLVPKDAIVRRAGGQVVFVVHDGKARLVPIKTGRAFESAIEVLEGKLQAGDSVVVTGNESLQDQAPVMAKASPGP